MTQFVQTQTLPVIVAGDFNMSPWTEKLERFTAATGLKRYNMLYLTPMRWGKVPLQPLVAIDNGSQRRSSPRSRRKVDRGSDRTTGRSSPTSRLPSLPSLEFRGKAARAPSFFAKIAQGIAIGSQRLSGNLQLSL